MTYYCNATIVNNPTDRKRERHARLLIHALRFGSKWSVPTQLARSRKTVRELAVEELIVQWKEGRKFENLQNRPEGQ